MPVDRFHAGWVLALTLTFGLSFLSCAGKRPPVEGEPTPAGPELQTGAAFPTAPETLAEPESVPVDPQASERLYGQLAADLLEFESGIEFLMAGEEVTGEDRIAAASQSLRETALECAVTPGCELDRFLGVFDYLMNEQSIALKRQRYRIDTMETSIAEDMDREPGTAAFAGEMPELARSVSLLKGTDLREIISLNGPVNAALDDWLTWMRPMLMTAYENYRYLQPDIAPIYEEAGLPEALLFAMIATESGGKVHAVSRAGATGPLQFMRHTGRKYGLKVVDDFDLRLDPEAATRANVAYLNDYFAQFNDSLEKVLAAYNGGENRMRGIQRRHGDTSFWDRKVYYSLPRETREYVPRILAAAWLFLHPEDYNLEFPVVEAETVRMELREEAALGELSICLGQIGNPGGWFRTLRNLNPRLSPGDRVGAGEEIRIPAHLVEVYEERCVGAEIVDLARELHDANYPDEPEMIPYTVRKGDTLNRIARRHKCASMREIAEINRIRAPRYTIRVGQELKIPGCQ